MISLETPQRKWASTRLERKPPGFSRVGQGLSSYDGDLRDPLWWPQERSFPMRVARGPLGIPLPSMPGPKTFVEWVLEPEDSSPVLTCILGYFWSLPSGVSPRLEWGNARALSSRAWGRKRYSSGCGWDSRVSNRVETGMSGNFLSCSKGVKDPLEVPIVRCD